MDVAKSEFNEILSTPGVHTHESFEDCGPIDAMHPCSAPDTGACCTTNKDTTNGACVSTNSTSNAPGTDAANDTHIKKETADSVPRNETHNTPEIGDLWGIADGMVSFEQTTEEIVDDIHRIITGLTESTFNDEELNGNDLIPLNMELKVLQEKGLFTHKIITVINEIVKEKYVKEINWDIYNKMMEALKTYGTIENSAIDINAKVSHMKEHETVAFLIENKHVTKEVLYEFEKIDKGKYDIQQKLARLKLIDVPGIVETMKTLEELGLLSELLLCKLTNVGKNVAELAREIRLQRKRINDTIQAINQNVTTYKLKQVIDGNNDDGTIVVYINCRDDSPDKNKRNKHPKKANKPSTSKVCRSEHNTPFCEKCGWRNSWVKAFKKRGIIVKEAASDNKDIWVNNIIL